MPGRTCRVSRIGAKRFVVSTSLIRFSSMSSTNSSVSTPALFTKISIGAISDSTRSMTPASCSGSDTSRGNGEPFSSFESWSISLTDLAASTTCAPCRANARAMEAPIPLLAPVISTQALLRSINSGYAPAVAGRDGASEATYVRASEASFSYLDKGGDENQRNDRHNFDEDVHCWT